MPVEAAVAVGTAVGTMEITVSKVELLRELTATQGVVERKTTIPILSNYLFEAADGELRLTATDLDLSLRTSCSAKVKKEGSCTIPARKLHDYVKLLPDADITIKLLENHWVSIRCGRSNTKMVGMAKSNFPSLPVFPTAGVVKIPGQVLRGLIARTGFAISSEESRYTLNGALMLLKPESITMVATDGHRLAYCGRGGGKIRRRLRRDENAGAEKSDGRTQVAARFRRRRNRRVRQRRLHSFLPHRIAPAHFAPTHRPVSQFRSRSAQRQ